jgi:chitodextrinase
MKRALVSAVVIILLFGFLPGCLIPAENVPPVPYLTASATSIDVGEEVIFSGNLSKDKDGEIVRYFWSFGDGNNVTGKYVTHKYDKGGNYSVILIITDDEGKKALQTITVHVNELPEPWINMSLPAYIHEPVYFYGNDSSDEDGFVVDYFWDFGDGTNKTGMSVSHTYTEKKLFRVTLTVTDNEGAKAAFPLEFDVVYRTYQVEWGIESILLPAPSGYLDEEESTHPLMNIEILNMTRIMFNLTWDDNIPFVGDPPLAEPVPNDDFILNITSPDEEYYERGPISSEKIIIYAPATGAMNSVPDDFTQEAESEDILENEISKNLTTDAGTGDWLFNITLVEAGGAIELPPPFEDADGGNSWQLMVKCFYYIPIITKMD